MIITSDPVNAFLDYGRVDVPSAPDGPLAGLTLAVKDNYNVAGYPTGGGSPVKAAESPIHTASAPIVQRMLDAGSRFVGKTQTDEITFSLNGQNMHFPEPINVRAEGRITGGSSSGSAAAVAAHLCDVALGSDTGGSVRAPASFCGLWGIRPTHGRVDLTGAMHLARSLDTPGYFTDDAALFERIAPVFLGEDGRMFRLTRAARADDAFSRVISDAAAQALAPAEAKVTAKLGPPEPVTIAPEGLESWYWTFRHQQALEAWDEHGAWVTSRNPTMTPGVRERLEYGATIGAEQQAQVRDNRTRQRARMEAIVGEDRVLVLPTVPGPAPRRDMAGEELQAWRERALSILCPAGLSGLPQVTMPLASVDGMPIGLSLIGPRGSDRALVSLAVSIATG